MKNLKFLSLQKHVVAGFYLTSLVLLAGFISSCSKDGGTGGSNDLVTYPFHHAKPIPNAIIYIKYGAKTFPGTDVSIYDNSKIASPNSGENPRATFTGLTNGYYFLYSVGFDSALGLTVTGGIPIQISKKSGETDINVPITEQ